MVRNILQYCFALFLLSNVSALSISIVGSRSESTLIHLYIIPTERCYLWCSPLPYGAPAPPVPLLKNMVQFQLEPDNNEVILSNLMSDTDYSVYCYAETMSTPPQVMTTPIEDTRVDLSTVSQNEFHATITSEMMTSSVFPLSINVLFSQPVASFTKNHIIIENAVINSLTQRTTTEFEVLITPDSPGEITLTLSKAIQSASGSTLYSPPTFTCTYKGVTLTEPSVLAYAHHAIVSVTANKASNLFAIHYPKSLAITPSPSVVMASGIPMIATQSLLYTANITGLNPDSSYIVYIAGTEEFGPSIATPVSDTRTAFTTVKVGEKPSEGKQCPKGWVVIDGLLLYSQCSGNGICLDSLCSCYTSYQGEDCGQLKGENVNAANTTHVIIHTSFHLDAPSTEDPDQDIFLQRTLQQTMAKVLDVSDSHVQMRIWERQGVAQSSLSLRGAEKARLKRVGILPYLPSESEQSLFVYFTTLVPTELSADLVDRIRLFLSSTYIRDIFDTFNIPVNDVQLKTLFIQESSDPYTCYNGRLDGDETDVDCGGNKCIARCSSKQVCTDDSDCDGSMSCFSGKCVGLEWTRIFYIAGISVAVIVIIVLISVVGSIMKKKRARVTPSNPPPRIVHTSTIGKRHNRFHHCFVCSNKEITYPCL